MFGQYWSTAARPIDVRTAADVRKIISGLSKALREGRRDRDYSRTQIEDSMIEVMDHVAEDAGCRHIDFVDPEWPVTDRVLEEASRLDRIWIDMMEL